MRVLIVNTLYAPHAFGGAEESIRVLAEALAARGETVSVVSTAPSPLASREQGGVRCHYVPLRNFYWPFDGRSRHNLKKIAFKTRDLHNPPMIRAVDDLLAAERPDVVHTNNLAGFSIGVWAAARRRGLPVVHTLRDYALLCPLTTMYKNGAPCAKLCGSCALFSSNKRRQSRKVASVVGNSHAILKRHLDNGCFAGVPRRHVIFNGCPPAPAGTPRRDGEPRRFGYLGRLSPEKGVGRLCEAFARLPPGEDAVLAIAGTGTSAYEQELRATHTTGRIVFRGHQNREAFLREIDVLVVPSLWPEPLARVVFEAYAHGVPVVVADRGGLPEAVVHEHTGLVYDASSTTDLTLALGRLARERALFEHVRAQAAKAAAAFAPERVAERYASAYAEALAGEPGPGLAQLSPLTQEAA